MTVLRHGYVLTMDEKLTEYKDGAVVFDASGILFVGDDSMLPEVYRALPFDDMTGNLVLPAFINTHCHLAMTPFRSLADDYPDRLHRFLMPLENKAMTRELAVAATKLAIAEMLLSGTGSALDMYYFESSVAQAAQEMGLRLWAGETILDAPHPDAKDFSESFDEMEKLLGKRSDLITPVIAPHAPYSLSYQHLKECLEYAKQHDIPWSMHLSEMPFEFAQCKEKYGMTPVEKMESEGLLSNRLIAAHLLLLGERDIEILKSHDVKVAHCPGSNSKAAKGVAPVPEMVKRGIHAGFGTDGAASGNTLDIFTQMKLYAVLQKNRLHDRAAVPARDIVPLATREGGYVLGAKVGQLKEGFKADIQVISLKAPNMIPCYDPYSVLVYSAQSHNVANVYVQGKCLVKNGQLTCVDYNTLVSDFQSASAHFEAIARSLL